MTEMKNFEGQLKQLEETVAVLERGDLPLEESLKAFEGGMAMVKECKEYLENLSLRIEKITAMNGANPVTEELDPEAL